MTTETTIQTLATQMRDQFTSNTRTTGETFYHLIAGSPEWMTDVIHAAHGSTLPDDTIYELCRDCVYALAECDEDADADECREAISEIQPEYRTYQLFVWAAQWSEYIDQVTSDMGAYQIESSSDLANLLQAAQMCQIEEIGGAIIQALEERADELNAEADEELDHNFSVGDRVNYKSSPAYVVEDHGDGTYTIEPFSLPAPDETERITVLADELTLSD